MSFFDEDPPPPPRKRRRNPAEVDTRLSNLLNRIELERGDDPLVAERLSAVRKAQERVRREPRPNIFARIGQKLMPTRKKDV